MTPDERRASLSLAGIFALRMLGLFLVLPVFALEAARYPGGDDPALVGLAMGIYGLTQAVMQVPLGLASDRVGRKKVIVVGLLVFALGSAVAALAGSVQMLIIGRAIQGAGAVSAAVTALLADQTRDEVRTKGMALVGISIAAMFALSLVAAPPLAAVIGLGGLFWLTCALSLAGIAVVLWWTPAEPAKHADVPRGRLADVWLHPHLWRLDLGVFVLHTVQMAMWVVVPALLVQAGLPKAQHWHVYLPAVLASFLMLGGLFAAERRGALRGAAHRHRAAVCRATGAAAAGAACAGAVDAGRAAVVLLHRLQPAGGHAAEPDLAPGASACARRGTGRLQHAAVAGPVCRRRAGRLAGQGRGRRRCWWQRRCWRCCGCCWAGGR
ncbi:MFS transporter [Ottowia beijingensis]|uniref:MFS transporter n=1 Tax=Ottowia beijingensis TaxID=1207057 RepID=UPI00358DB032